MDESVSRKVTGKSVAVTQTHRGHGASTMSYYLARVFVSLNLRVLLVDLTSRHERLLSLTRRGPTKNLVLWMPPLARSRDAAPALEQARIQTAGKADVILIDADASLIEELGTGALGIDYTCVLTEATKAGQDTADRLAERLHDEEPPRGRVGAIFSRVDAPSANELPEQTETRHLPVLGYFPADYLLAGGDAYSLKGGEPTWPHDTYLYAILRIGQKLGRIVPLERSREPNGSDISGAHVSPMDGRYPRSEERAI